MENEEIKEELASLGEAIKIKLVPKDPKIQKRDHRNSSWNWGDEAAIFVGIYLICIEDFDAQGWKMSLMSLNESEKGVIKKLHLDLREMKFLKENESGFIVYNEFQQLKVRDEFTLLQLPWPYCQRLKK